ncbi:MAG: peptide-N4-asparagine amidase [Acidilobaceae archaeon]
MGWLTIIGFALIGLLVLQVGQPTSIDNLGGSSSGYDIGVHSQSDPRAGVSTRGFWSWQDYPYFVPDVEPIVVDLVSNYTVSWFTKPDSFIVDVDWLKVGWSFSRILLRADVYLVSIVPGRPAVQYDRPLWVYINGVPALLGSTVQRFNQTVIVDVTHLYNIIVGRSLNITIALRNWALPDLGLTGAFVVNLKLLLYPGPKPEGLPATIIPLFAYSSRTSWHGISNVWLDRASPIAWEVVRIPGGVSRALLILYTEGFSVDEFWYYNIPPDRLIVIASDGVPIAIAQPQPWIHTGGLSPLLWRPVPNIKTLGFEPLIIDVTGMLPLLVGTRNITITVSRLENYWTIIAALALYTEPRALSYTLLRYTPIKSEVSESERQVGVTAGGVRVFNYTIVASRSLSAISIIGTTAGSFIASTHMSSFIRATQLYDEEFVWTNLTLKLGWDYRTSITPSERIGIFKPFKFSKEWVRDVKYGFLVFPEGDISKATTGNPVPANFSLRVIIDREELRIDTSLMLTGIERSYEGSLRAVSELAGRMMFISPTSAIITALTKAMGETIRIERANEWRYSRLAKTNLPLSEFYTKIHGYNEWPRWSYKSIELTIKQNPSNNIIS